MNDDIWAATTVAILSGFWMYEVSPTSFGGETWLRLGQAELNSMSLWVVLICWALRNKFGSLLINC